MIKNNPRHIYLMRSIEGDGTISYKIGYTKNDPIKRIKQLQTGNKYDIELIHSFWSEYGTTLESTLHSIYKDKLGRGEWYDLSREDVNEFLELCEKYENNFDNLYKNNSYLNR